MVTTSRSPFSVASNGVVSQMKSRLMRRFFVGKKLTRSGIAFMVSGVASITLSVWPTTGFERIYFFWSFTYVTPSIIPKGSPPGAYSIPAVVHTYEVLLPWFLIGLFLTLFGIFLLKKEIYPKKAKWAILSD